MILVDLNQVMISNLMMHVGNQKSAPIEVDVVRHMILNSLRMYKVRFGEQYGDIVSVSYTHLTLPTTPYV